MCKGRQEFGNPSDILWLKASKLQRRELIKKEIRKGEEEERWVKAVGMAKQGAWTRWEGVTELKISWEDLWKVEPVRMEFMLKSIYDLLPTPSNLVLWNKKEEAACALCKGCANLKHILSCCKVTLTQGRYSWCHDQVLRVIAESRETKGGEKQKVNLAKTLCL